MPSQVYEHLPLTADIVLLALGEQGLMVLLTQRGEPPFEGSWAFRSSSDHR